MADFRKWLLAFAGVVLLLSTGSSVQGAVSGPATCTVSSPGSLVRAEGFTELTGDIVLDCTGGTQTAVGQPIPQVDITVGFGNTNITSRLNPHNKFAAGNGTTLVPTEALLLIDEPTVPPPTNPPTTPSSSQPPYTPCPSLIGCTGNGGGPGGDVYLGATPVPSAYEGVLASKTGLVPASLNGFAGVTFLGVPIDAPGTTGHRIIRITNLRADAVGAAGGNLNITGLLPITANVSIGNTSAISLTTTNSVTVAYVVPGLKQTVVPAVFTQCNAPTDVASFVIAEGFAYAFKPRISRITAGLPNFPNGTETAQNVPGLSNTYYTESGFTTSTTAGDIGVADSGTRFKIVISNLQNGVSLSVPNIIDGTTGVTPGPNGTGTSSTLVLALVTGADALGGGGTVSTTAGTTKITGSYAGGSTATSTTLTYEVVAAAGTVPESATIPFVVAFPSGQVASNIPFVTQPGKTSLLKNNFSQMSIWFAPSEPAAKASTDGWNQPQDPVGGDVNWIPRFADLAKPGNAIQITPCTCNLLFPYITGKQGYDTGIAIANTSADPFGGFSNSPTNTKVSNTGQTGAVTLYFFGTSQLGTGTETAYFSVPEPAATKALVIPPGCVLAFDLKSTFTAATSLAGCHSSNTSTGGSAVNNYPINGTAALTPMSNFEGYVIATASFQYCHGTAFLVAPGGGQGATYTAIELDTPFWAASIPGVTTGRTGQLGESQGQ